jgi:GTP:adenosylcobinamide-phosphate guanylyltransferase
VTGSALVSALVLAGSRRGEQDPVARYRQVSWKCLATVGGIPMLTRVVQALTACPRIGTILVSLDDAAQLDLLPELAALRAAGRICTLTSAATLSGSVADAFAQAGAPLLVTTADHALLSPAMLEHFLAAADAAGADVAAGLASEAIIGAEYPATKRTYLRFRGGAYSGANLFALRTPSAADAIAFWARIERDRKRPWRLARAFGPSLLLAYLLRVCTLDQAMALVSRRLSLQAVAVQIPIAEAAIDVDKPADLDLVEEIVARRERAA